jgi:phi13 family phage major tail protein
MAQQVTKGRRMGLKDVYVALVTSDTTAEYVTDTPVLLARALSAKITEKKTTDTLYSDDTIEDFVESLDSIDVEIDLADLDPQQESLLRGSTFANGFLVDNQNDLSNTVAIGWRARRTDGKYEFV